MKIEKNGDIIFFLYEDGRVAGSMRGADVRRIFSIPHTRTGVWVSSDDATQDADIQVFGSDVTEIGGTAYNHISRGNLRAEIWALADPQVDKSRLISQEPEFRARPALTTRPVAQSYDVEFHSNGGTNIPDVTVAAGGRVPAPEPISRDGFNFEGWYKNPELTVVYDFNTETVSDDITIYASWSAGPVQTYTVTFDTNGGNGNYQPMQVTSGQRVTRPANDPSLSGRNFAGWFTAASGGQQFNFNNPITRDVILYAQYSTLPTYTVSFDTQGSSDTFADQQVQQGDAATRPAAAPRRQGFRFNDWYTAATGGQVYDFSTPVTSDVQLFAQYTQVPQRAVAFRTINDRGIQVLDIQFVNDGETVARPATDPTRSGFNFDGWYTAQTGGDIFDFSAPITADNTSIFAQYYADNILRIKALDYAPSERIPNIQGLEQYSGNLDRNGDPIRLGVVEENGRKFFAAPLWNSGHLIVLSDFVPDGQKPFKIEFTVRAGSRWQSGFVTEASATTNATHADTGYNYDVQMVAINAGEFNFVSQPPSNKPKTVDYRLANNATNRRSIQEFVLDPAIYDAGFAADGVLTYEVDAADNFLVKWREIGGVDTTVTTVDVSANYTGANKRGILLGLTAGVGNLRIEKIDIIK